jgi:hypothetical protein
MRAPGDRESGRFTDDLRVIARVLREVRAASVTFN